MHTNGRICNLSPHQLHPTHPPTHIHTHAHSPTHPHTDTLIGFEFPSYTYPELATDSQQTIRLIKESLSDITVSVVISVLAETPPTSTAASENDYSLIETMVYEFSPEDDFEDVTFTVLADENVEMLEGVVLRVSGADGSASVLPGTNPTTNVFITDTDGKDNNKYHCT